MKLKTFFLILLIAPFIGCQPEKIKTANGNEIKISSLIGMNVFDIAYECSKASPETLTGTNNQRWVVYYKDIDVTLETNKSNNIVQKAKKGRKAKNSTWAN